MSYERLISPTSPEEDLLDQQIAVYSSYLSHEEVKEIMYDLDKESDDVKKKCASLLYEKRLGRDLPTQDACVNVAYIRLHLQMKELHRLFKKKL